MLPLITIITNWKYNLILINSKNLMQKENKNAFQKNAYPPLQQPSLDVSSRVGVGVCVYQVIHIPICPPNLSGTPPGIPPLEIPVPSPSIPTPSLWYTHPLVYPLEGTWYQACPLPDGTWDQSYQTPEWTWDQAYPSQNGSGTRHTHPMDRILKHYLPATSLVGG